MKRIKIIVPVIAAAAIGAVFLFNGPKRPEAGETECMVTRGTIRSVVSSTGSVLPQNRLAVKPPLAGRIEKIFVEEGEFVRAGKVIALMSSSDRAALIDAARASGESNVKQWEEIYKPIPIVAPISGQVIVRDVEPGQTVDASTAIIVLSDRLIVKANVDETDVGKIRRGQRAQVTLDAYQDTAVAGRIDHIYYESVTVNNVTVYKVDVALDRVPDYFRSGMSANIDIIMFERKDVLTLPADAVKRMGEKSIVLRKDEKGNVAPMDVTTGVHDESRIEITVGLKESETVVISRKNYSVQPAAGASNPLMPGPRKQSKTSPMPPPPQ